MTSPTVDENPEPGESGYYDWHKAVAKHHNDKSGVGAHHAASRVSVTTSGLAVVSSTDVQAALADLDGRGIDTVDTSPLGGSDGDLVGVDGAGSAKLIDSGTFNRSEARDIRQDGGVLDGSTSDTQAVKDALAASDTALIADGTCLIDGTITLSNDQVLVIAANAEVVVPNGYADVLFRFHGSRARIEGSGNISELGTEAQNWTAFYWDGSDSQGIHQCETGHVHVEKPGTLFLLEENDTGGYVNGNRVWGTRCRHPIICWEFKQATPNTSRYLLSRNAFYGVDIQGSTDTTHVLKNIVGAENEWHGCVVFDAGSATRDITQYARDTLFVGGSGVVDATLAGDGERTRFITPEIDAFAPKVGRSLADRWFPAPATGSASTYSPGNELLVFVPLWLHTEATLKGVAVDVTSAGETDSVIRLGVYDDNGAHPDALLVDAGTVAADTTGEKQITGLSASLPGRLVWVCAVVQGAPSTAPTVTSTVESSQPWLGGSAAQAISRWTAGYSQSGVSGALPDPANAGNTAAGKNVPTLAVQFA